LQHLDEAVEFVRMTAPELRNTSLGLGERRNPLETGRPEGEDPSLDVTELGEGFSFGPSVVVAV
jgi:hypothetical protein